jgi:hypothetical protein
VAGLIVRIAFGALGAIFIHDAVWWENSWFFGNQWAAGGNANRRMLKPSTAFHLVCLVH